MTAVALLAQTAAPGLTTAGAAAAGPSPAGGAAPATAPSAPVPAPLAPPPGPYAGAPMPADAAEALERARAAYEYGDMEMVADSARLVAEGRLRPTPSQRAQALRFLGVALYLTGRPEGAETAFFDLLRLKPGVRLDPTTTRPDVVTFFENVRARHHEELRHAEHDRPRRHFILNFLPPAGQFQNGNRTRGFAIAGLELLSAGVAIGTYAQLRSWVDSSNQTFPGHDAEARKLKVVNNVAFGVLIATIAAGIVDGAVHFNRDSDEPPLAFVTPGGLGFRF